MNFYIKPDTNEPYWTHGRIDSWGEPLWSGEPTEDELKYGIGISSDGSISLDLEKKQNVFLTAKQKKLCEISNAFDNALANGVMFSSILQINIDARRGGIPFKDDKDNVQTLINRMTRLGENTTTYYGANDEQVTATLDQVRQVLIELEDRGMELFAKKKLLEYQVNTTTNQEQLDAIQVVI